MTGAIMITILAVLCAVGVLAAVLGAERPEEGWVGWIRSAFHAWRSDELAWKDADVDDGEVGGLGTLYLLSEPGNAYTQPEELGGSLATRLREAREHASAARPAPSEGHPSHAGA